MMWIYKIGTVLAEGDDAMGNLNTAMQNISKMLEVVVGDAITFLQAIGVITTSVMMTYYTLTEMAASPQENPMQFQHKTRRTLVAFLVLVIVPTFIKILKDYLGNGV